MAQNNEVAVPVRRYTRVDFIALQATLNNISVEAVVRLYYNEEDLEERGCRSLADLEEFLEDMRDHLAQRATRANPAVASILADARSRKQWSKSVIDFLLANTDKDTSRPQLEDALSAWFKPTARKALWEARLKTVGDFKRFIESGGVHWYRSLMRIGQGKARAFERWFEANAVTLGPLRKPSPVVSSDMVLVRPGTSVFVPLERMGVVSELDGSQGRNRNNAFCFVAASNDLQAIQAYLNRFRERPKTYLAYQRELERFLLWCVCERGLPMSGVLTDDCEAYKDFLRQLPPRWCGRRQPRGSSDWRPFVGKLDPKSARYAVQILRTFFEWLVRVRYLGGNPWITVADPVVEQQELPIQIEKALPAALWATLSDEGGLLDRACERHADRGALGRPLDEIGPSDPAVAGIQYRLARAAILLLGTSGLRREEAANATRDRMTSEFLREKGMWSLAVLGKRKKWRTVFFPRRTGDALADHWRDRGLCLLEDAQLPAPLLSPLVLPPTTTARRKHLEPSAPRGGAGFSVRGLHQLVTATLKRMAKDSSLDLTQDERAILMRAAPHAFRHTFATLSVADEVHLNVLQQQLGHASLNTTSIYVQAEKARRVDQLSRRFQKS